MSNRTERAWVSVKLWALRSKTWGSWLVALAGLAVVAVGAYIAFAPAFTVAPFSTLIDTLPGTLGLGFYDGVLVMLAGIAVVIVAARV